MFFYLEKDDLIERNFVNVLIKTQTPIPNYKEIKNFGELLEYEGDTIPIDLVYDKENNAFYSESERPTKFHSKINGQWQVVDEVNYKKYCNEGIDKLKAEILEYGFDYNIGDSTHRQRCRDKDIAYMTSTITALDIAKRILGKDETVIWYFEDNVGVELDFIGLSTLMLYGTTYIQSIFKAENYFKSLEEAKEITKDEFLEKIKEIQQEKLKVNSD